MAKRAKIYDGSAWQDIATAVPDLSSYQTVANTGLQLVKKQTIGTGVSSVTVTDAFNSTYENYLILISGGVASVAPTYLQLRLDSVATGYYGSLIYSGFTGGSVLNIGTSNGAIFPYTGYGNTDSLSARINLTNVSLPEQTVVSHSFYDNANAGHGSYVCISTTAHTAFTIIPNGSATLTGGTIYVYGYQE